MSTTSIDYTRRLERLLDVCRNLTANLDLEPLLQSLIEVASELTSSESSLILVFEKETNSLKFIAAPFFVMKKLQAVLVPLDQGVEGQVFASGQPMALNNAEDARIYRAADSALNESTHSILAVPLIFKGNTIGVFETINKQGNANYTEEDIRILEVIASQAAVVIRNRRLLEDSQSSYEKVMDLERLKSDFIAIASHELRTPLGLVLGHANYLQENARDDQKEQLDLIVHNALKLQEINDQLSNIDDIERGLSSYQRSKVAILPLVQNVVDTFQKEILEKKIMLSIEISHRNLMVEGDYRKIAIVLRNLLKNAVIFTNEGGKIQVRAEQVPGYVQLSVIDNGIGIPTDEQDKIFERFYQVEKHLTRRHGGMGLGLSIAADIVKMHGGCIWVESKEGKGSKFSFLLPQKAAQASAAERVFRS